MNKIIVICFSLISLNAISSPFDEIDQHFKKGELPSIESFDDELIGDCFSSLDRRRNSLSYFSFFTENRKIYFSIKDRKQRSIDLKNEMNL